MQALFDDEKNLWLPMFATIVIEEIFLLIDAVFKFGLLEIFFDWFGKQFAVIGLFAFACVLGAVWLTILFIFHRFDVYNNVAAIMKRISSVKKSQGG